MEPGLQEVAAEGRGYSLLDYLDAVSRREKLVVAVNSFHQTYDLLVTPSLPISAFAAGEEVPAGSDLQRWPQWSPFSYPFNRSEEHISEPHSLMRTSYHVFCLKTTKPTQYT